MMNSMQTKSLLFVVMLAACTNNVTIQSSSPPPAKAPESTSRPTPKSSPIGAGAGAPAPVKETQNNQSANPSQQSSCNYFAGKAIGNQVVNVDTCSIKYRNPTNVSFIYSLGNERIESSANCSDFRWTTYPENQVHTPQSRATENMLHRVCQGG